MQTAEDTQVTTKHPCRAKITATEPIQTGYWGTLFPTYQTFDLILYTEFDYLDFVCLGLENSYSFVLGEGEEQEVETEDSKKHVERRCRWGSQLRAQK